MRIKRLIIFNFKNFLGKVEFDLDKKMTIIYGENGFGKSSFFDALEWGITGKVSRFTTNNSDGDFNDIFLINSDIVSSNQSIECYVEVLIDNYILQRKITLNNQNTRTTVELKNIETGEVISGKQSVESKLKLLFLPNMINSTFNLKQPYILSQDQVTDFILKDNPKDKYKALANLVGLEKIINYSHNIRLIKRDLSGKKEKLETLIASKQEVKDSVISKNHYTREYLETKIEKLSLNLKSLDDLSVVLNEKRDEITKKIYEYNNKIQIISPYKSMNKSIQKLINEKEQLTNKIERVKKHIEYVKSSNSNLSIKISELELFEENRKKLEVYIQSAKEIEEKIEDIKFSMKLLLGNDDINLEQIDIKLNEFNNTYSVYNYNFTYREEYILGKANITELSSKIKINEEIISKLNRRIQRKTDRFNRIDNLLYESGTHTRETKIYELISNIKDFIEKNNERDICPVCSTNLNGSLISTVENNRKHLEEVILKSTHRFQKILALKNSIEDSLKRDTEEVKNLKSLNETYKGNIKKLDNRMVNITNNAMFDNNIIYQTKELINSKMLQINNSISNLNIAKNNLIDLSSLENQKNNYNLSISKMRKAIEIEGTFKLEEYREKLNKRNRYLSELNKSILNDEKKYNEESIQINLLMSNDLDLNRPLIGKPVIKQRI